MKQLPQVERLNCALDREFLSPEKRKNDPIENTALLTLVDLWTNEPTGMK